MKKLYIVTGAGGHLGGDDYPAACRKSRSRWRGLLYGKEKREDMGNVHYYRGDVRKVDSLRPLFSGCGDMEDICYTHGGEIIDISSHVVLGSI